MSQPISISVDSSGFDKALAAQIAKLDDMRPVLDQIGLYVVRSIKRNFRDGGRPNKWDASRRASEEGGKTLKDTNLLAGSITHDVQGKEVAVGTNTLYARIIHFGGVIKPVNVKALPVPLNKKARAAQKKVKSVREIKGLAFIPSEKPNTIGVLGMPNKGGDGFEAWFALRKSVKMPARPFLLLQPGDYKQINAIMRDHLYVQGT